MNLLKNRNWTFPWKLEFVSDILWMIADIVKNKERLQNKACEKYQDLSEKEKQKARI